MATPSLENSYVAKVTALPRFGLDGSTAFRINVHQKTADQGVCVCQSALWLSRAWFLGVLFVMAEDM